MNENIKEIIGNLIPAERKVAVLEARNTYELCDVDLRVLRVDLAVAEADLWRLHRELHREQNKEDNPTQLDRIEDKLDRLLRVMQNPLGQ